MAVAQAIAAHPGLRLEVEGHTDNVGSDEFNQLLSEKRAATVRNYLVSQGISMNSIVARGFGKTQSRWLRTIPPRAGDATAALKWSFPAK